MTSDRNIDIKGDATGNVLVTGDSNVVRVVIVQRTRFVEPVTGENPYRGLQAFEERDALLFFGREEITARLWEDGAELIVDRKPRLLAVLGRSGSSKSSVVRAGLLPALGRRQWPETDVVGAAVFAPGDEPIAALGGAIAKARHAIEQQSVGQGRVVIVADQFETLFTGRAAPEARAEFVRRLVADSCAPGGDVFVILTMRSDFLGALQPYPELERLIAEPKHHRIVTAMSRKELEAAIAGPMPKDRPLPQALVDRLVDQAYGREGALPLLQYTLTQLWEGMAKGTAPEHYFNDALGGSIATAIAKEADLLLAELGDDRRKAIARRAFMHMVELHEQTLVRRPAAVRSLVGPGETADEVLDVLRHFAERRARLVTLSGRSLDDAQQQASGDVIASIAHEALITGWPTLHTLVTSHPADQKFHRSVADDAEQWDRSGRPRGSLYRPPNLDLLRDLVDRRRSEMTAIELAFFEASDAAWQNEQDAAGRRAWWARVVAVVMTVLTLLAGGASWYAFRQRDVAFSRLLAARAVSQLRIDPERSVLLALEAARVSGTAQAEDALRQAVEESRIRRRLVHDGSVTMASFDSGGTRVLTVSGNLARIRDASTGETIATLSSVSGIGAAAFSPDGGRVLVADATGTTKLWDAQTGEQLSLRGHEGPIDSVVFGGNGGLAVTVGYDDGARIWRLPPDVKRIDLRTATDGQSSPAWTADGRRIIPEWTQNVIRAATSPDGKLIATGSRAGPAYVWEATTGRLVTTLEGHATHIDDIAFSPDSAKVITASHDRTARIWDAKSGQQIAALGGHSGVVFRAAFTPDGSRVVTASWDATVRVWDASSGTPLAELRGHTGIIEDLALSPDGKYALTAGSDGTAWVWGLRTGRAVAVLRGHAGEIYSAEFSPDGKKVVTAGADGTARLWSLEVTELIGHDGGLNAAAFSQDSRRVVTGSSDGTARVWDAQSGRNPLTLRGHTGPVNRVAFDQEGKVIVTLGLDRTARIWDASAGSPIAVLSASGPPNFASPSPDSKFVAIPGGDGYVDISSPRTGEHIAKLEGHSTRGIMNAEFSSNSELLLTRDGEGIVRIWDTRSWTRMAEITADQGDITDAAFSPDGRHLVTVGRNGEKRLWRAETGERLPDLAGYNETTLDTWLARNRFSPDGTLELSWSGDVAYVSDVRTERRVAELRGHAGSVELAAFSPDGKLVLTASDDSTARIYSCSTCIPMNTLVELARARVTRELTPEEKDAYLR